MEPDLKNSILPHAERLVRSSGLKGPFTLLSIDCGGNNRAFMVKIGKERLFLKYYFRHKEDLRDRLKTEFTFISFAWEHGLRAIPRPIAADELEGLGLYEFVNGRRLRKGEVTPDYVAQAIDFFMALNTIKNRPEALHLPVASESCFTIAEHIACVDTRLKRLQEIDPEDIASSEAKSFILCELSPMWQRVRQDVKRKAMGLGLKTHREMPYEERCLSPSDFGFHNALLEKDGSLRFIDFEYAGWDDPAKMVCDFFCQPEVPVPLQFLSLFENVFAPELPHMKGLIERIRLIFPIHYLKWCCIILNDFLPEGSERREFAGKLNKNSRRKSQLKKGRDYLRNFKSLEF